MEFTSNQIKLPLEKNVYSKKHIKLAIMGKMCSGKTTLSNHIKSFLKNEYNIELKSHTFAGKVYELAYDLFNMDKQKKDRKLLQTIGTLMRSVDEEVWVKYLMKNTKNSHVIVEDCRYENEFAALENEDFVFIKIDIDREYQIYRLRRTYPETYIEHINNLNHASEIGIEKIPNEKFDLILNAKDNELNFKKIEEFLKNYIEKNINLENNKNNNIFPPYEFT
jgi:uridine kinase